MMTHCLRPILLGGVLLMAACMREDSRRGPRTQRTSPRATTWGSRRATSARRRTQSRSPPRTSPPPRRSSGGAAAGAASLAGTGLVAGGPPAAIAGQWRGKLGRPRHLERGARERGPGRVLRQPRRLWAWPARPGRRRSASRACRVPPPSRLHRACRVWVKVEGNAVMHPRGPEAGGLRRALHRRVRRRRATADRPVPRTDPLAPPRWPSSAMP